MNGDDDKGDPATMLGKVLWFILIVTTVIILWWAL